VRSRKRCQNDQSIEDVEVVAPGTERADDNIRDQLESAFASMSEEVKEIVMLHCLDGYSDAEIAEMRGETGSKVAAILSCPRSRLKGAGLPSKEKPDET
jgi:DNA-directed RNA polymerase specialized sigma24 family protein